MDKLIPLDSQVPTLVSAHLSVFGQQVESKNRRKGKTDYRLHYAEVCRLWSCHLICYSYPRKTLLKVCHHLFVFLVYVMYWSIRRQTWRRMNWKQRSTTWCLIGVTSLGLQYHKMYQRNSWPTYMVAIPRPVLVNPRRKYYTVPDYRVICHTLQASTWILNFCENFCKRLWGFSNCHFCLLAKAVKRQWQLERILTTATWFGFVTCSLKFGSGQLNIHRYKVNL